MNLSLLSRALRLAYVFAIGLLLTFNLAAQTSVKIRGTVRSNTGETLIGVTLRLGKTGRGAHTNQDGRFEIEASLGQKLLVSYIGMKSQEVKITSTELNIVLEEDIQSVDEVVVTGYQKIRNRVYTGASTSVKVADIKLEGVVDISRMLEGRVAGLSIQNISGSFGSGPRINIRGGASIIGQVQPLWVIDGAVYEDLVPLTLDQLASGDAATLISSAVAGINATDITDIQVLKDASATSIYGTRALNGVIVITTKSGRRNTPIGIHYSLETGVRMRPSYSDYDLLNSQETMSVYQEMERKGYFSLERTLYGRRSGIYYQMYRDMRTVDPNTGSYLLPNTPEARLAFLKDREYANTDWFEHLFTHRPITSHTLSLSGGSDKITTYASLGLYNDAGWSIADRVRRITANLKSQFYISDRLHATLSMQGNMRDQKAPGTMPERRNTTLGSYERDFDINPFVYALTTSRTLRPRSRDGKLEYYRNNWAPFNILNEYDNNYLDIEVLDLKLQGEASYKVNKYLEARLLASVRRATTATSHYVKEGSNVLLAYRAAETPQVAADNIYLLRDKDNPLLQPQVALSHGGIFNKTTTSLSSYLVRAALDYNRTVGKHDFKGFAFVEMRSTDRSINPFQGYGIQYDRGNQIFTDPLIFKKLSDQGTPYFSLQTRHDRGVSLSWSGTYAYDGRYIANAVINYEGSNASGKYAHTRWLPTWNIGGKWNIDREAFFTPSSTLKALSLRASYGLTAKMNEEAINSESVYQTQIIHRYRQNDRENALRILHLENRDLTWEKMYELNVGFDATLLNGRLTATLDVYQRNAFDLIDLVRTSGVGGQYYKYANFGDMRTRGFELSLHARPIETKDFSWSTSLTLSLMDQKITRLLNAPNTFDMVAGRGRGNIVGFPRGALFSFNYQGLNSEGLPTFDFGLYPQNNSAHSSIAGADFIDSQYSKSYLIYHGPVDPQIIGGLANTWRYKSWELSLFVSMQAGNKIRLNPTFDPAFADLNVFSRDYYHRWLNHGDELTRDVPVIPSQDLVRLIGQENIERAYNTYNYSQMRVADGSFVRLKNIALGYHVPKHYLQRWGIKELGIKLNITNPFLIYSDKRLNGQDPEYYRSGGVSMPTPRQYTLTLNVGI